MLFYQDLEEIIFNRHTIFGEEDIDELVIISGYVGPNPISRLKQLPFNTTVIYGMYGEDGIGDRLNQTLIKLNDENENTNIIYSTIPVHSKCYIWKKENNIKHALIGSANFSSNGLNTPFREVLAETNRDSFTTLNDYIEKVIENSIDCHEAITRNKISKQVGESSEIFDPDFCVMTLLDPATGEVQNCNGLNWGQGNVAHTNKNDANIPIRAKYLENYPNLFPEKRDFPQQDRTGKKRHNDHIEIIWDDGTTMEGLLEGNYTKNGKIYPKQISSCPEKKVLGEYIRSRIGVPSEHKITRTDLERYGRTDITVSLQGEGIYYFDFSVNKTEQNND